jgi:hypothetical protein
MFDEVEVLRIGLKVRWSLTTESSATFREVQHFLTKDLHASNGAAQRIPVMDLKHTVIGLKAQRIIAHGFNPGYAVKLDNRVL